MAYSPIYAILYRKIYMYLTILFLILYSCYLRLFRLVLFQKNNIDRLIKLQKRCIGIINFSDINFHTDLQYSELKLLKVNDIFSLSKLLFMFDFIKENIPEDACMELSPLRCFMFQKGKLQDLA